MHREALAIRRAVPGPDSLLTLQSEMSLAELLMQRGEFAGAEQTMLRVQAEVSRRWGDDVKASYRMNQKLGEAYFRSGRWAEAKAQLETAFVGYRRLLAADHPDVLAVASDLGQVLAPPGRGAGRRGPAHRGLRRTAPALRRRQRSHANVLRSARPVVRLSEPDPAADAATARRAVPPVRSHPR